MFLMFGVGMHFLLNDLLQVRRIALPGAILQIAVATLLWNRRQYDLGLEFWLCLGLRFKPVLCQVPVVLLKALGDRGLLNSVNGKIARRLALGWRSGHGLGAGTPTRYSSATRWEVLAGGADDNIWLTLGITLLKVNFRFHQLLCWSSGNVLFNDHGICRSSWFTWTVYLNRGGCCGLNRLWRVQKFRCFHGTGRFLCGMVVKESTLATVPKKKPFLYVKFCHFVFVAVGMLFDPRILVEQRCMCLQSLQLLWSAKLLPLWHW